MVATKAWLPRLVAAIVSGVATAGLCWLILRARADAPSVEVVDTRAEYLELMEDRTPEAAPAEASADYPPPLLREPLDEETAAIFFSSFRRSDQWLYDELTYTRRMNHEPPRFRRFAEHPDGGWTHVTNDYGMREDEDVLTEAPDLRILATGDSHTDGLCANSESFPNVLEALLQALRPDETIESLNAGTGGYNLYNYVGVFERFAALEPDVYIVAVYGGNDFSRAMTMQRYFHGRPPHADRPHVLGKSLSQGALGAQEVHQELYFANNPDDVPVAIDLACSVSVELDRLCSAAGARLVLVYLPPPTSGQPHHFEDERDAMLAEAGLADLELGASDRIADAWLRFLEERGFAFLDLRPPFRGTAELLYWRTDHHLNVAGHRLTAELLFERFFAPGADGDSDG